MIKLLINFGKMAIVLSVLLVIGISTIVIFVLTNSILLTIGFLIICLTVITVVSKTIDSIEKEFKLIERGYDHDI